MSSKASNNRKRFWILALSLIAVCSCLLVGGLIVAPRPLVESELIGTWVPRSDSDQASITFEADGRIIAQSVPQLYGGKSEARTVTGSGTWTILNSSTGSISVLITDQSGEISQINPYLSRSLFGVTLEMPTGRITDEPTSESFVRR